MCAVPHHMWRASGGKGGPAGPSPAAGGSCPSFPSRHAAAPTRCTPEGTPALRLLLRCAACRSCTTLVGMSPPMLRACGAACRLRCSAGDFYEMRARTRCARTPLMSAPSPCRCTPEGTPALRLLLRYAACRSCTTLVGMSPPMLRACSAACRLRCSAGDFYEMRARTRCARTPLTSAPSPCWCTPEGTPALRPLLRCAACRPCTTLVGMSPPMLRACSAACCLRFSAGDIHAMCACTSCARIPLMSAPSPCRTLRRYASQRIAVVCLVGLIRLVHASPRCHLQRLPSSVEAAHHVLGFRDGQFVHPRRDDR